jgi:hypothetical protein
MILRFDNLKYIVWEALGFKNYLILGIRYFYKIGYLEFK